MSITRKRRSTGKVTIADVAQLAGVGTMTVPHRKIGIEAGRALLARLNSGDWSDQKAIASSLCLRESC